MEDNQDNSSIDNLQTKIYSRRFKSTQKDRGDMSSRYVDVPQTWKEEEEVKKSTQSFIKKSFYKKLFVGSIIFFVLAIGFAVFTSFFGGQSISPDRIDIQILGNTFTEGGESFPLTVEVSNRNNGPLELVDLAVEYPKGAAPDGEMERFRLSVGDIGAGERKEEDIDVVLFGEQNAIQNIKFTIEYHIAGSNSTFTKQLVYPVTIARSPITIFVEAPTDISPNQEMTLDITVRQDASTESANLGVKVDYPIGFKFEESTPAALQSNNVFALGNIPVGGEKVISIKGKMFGEDGEERSFRVYTGEFSSTNATELGVVLSSQIHTVLLRKPFLEASLVYGEATGDEYIVKGGEKINAEIQWANNLPDRIDDAQIVLKFSGNAFDEDAVDSQLGFWKSETNELIFSQSAVKAFESIAPGESGTLKFEFTPRTTSEGGGVITSPAVVVSVSIKGNQILSGSGTNSVSTVEEKRFQIASNMKLSGRTLQRSGLIDNTGPLPPNSGTPTTYTIVWSITNSSNILSDGLVKAKLPFYVDWTGQTAPNTENITYNPNTREVTWRMGNIAPSVGYNSPVREGSFQVRLNASASQAGTSPVLVEEATATAEDAFTGALLESKWTSLTTRLLSDEGSSATEWNVAF